MKKTALIALCLVSLAATSRAGTIFPILSGKPLIDSLRKYYKPTRTLSDANCRDTLYGEIELLDGDSLICVYSGWTIRNFTGDPSTWANSNDINPEHTWPESMLDSSKATQDMQHLFPTEMGVNSYRSSLPFGECADASTTTWSRNNVHQTAIPGSNIDEWSETISNNRFEPREIQKGKTARAMYYMLTMWQIQDTTLAWWTGQKDTLYKWHCQHPADATESTRTYKVAQHQSGKVNPFIIDSTLIRRAFFPLLPTNTQVNFTSAASAYGEAAGSFGLMVAVYSPSQSDTTTVQVMLTAGTGTAADVNEFTTQTLTFPPGSSAPESLTITITDDPEMESTETIIFKLRNASGGSNATVGGDSVFTLTINDDDTPASTAVSFSPASSSKAEGDAPFSITVAIANPSGAAATTADVVLAPGSGSADDINNYATQTVTFTAGSSTPQNVPVTITDDALAEGTETLVFKLRNVTGGTGALAGDDSTYTLTLGDNDGSPSGGQVIGSFADMDGGFELQTAGTIATNSSIATAGTETTAVWSVQNTSGTGTITANGGRSSPKYCTFGATASRRLQSPTVMISGALASATQYQVQYYYRSAAVASNGQVGLSPDGTSSPGPSGAYTSVTYANTGGAWTKVNQTHTSGSSANDIRLGVGVIRFSAASGTDIDIDDYSVYAGSAVDNTAPNRPDTVNISGTKGEMLSVTWPAADGGVDGGGYLVVRGTSDPTTAPDVNGIYAVGNAIGSGLVAYIGTATSFVDTGLTTSTNYFYRVYTVDKAFNYSNAATGMKTTGSLAVELSHFTCELEGNSVTLHWRTESEAGSYMWIVERSTMANGGYVELTRLPAAGQSTGPKEYSWIDHQASAGATYYYRIGELSLEGTISYYGPVLCRIDNVPPPKDRLLGSAPNPFRHRTAIKYQVGREARVSLSVYNIAGQLVKRLDEGLLPPGDYQSGWDGTDFCGSKQQTGLYFYRLSIGQKSHIGKVLLVR